MCDLVLATSGITTDFLILALFAFPAWILSIHHSRRLVPYLILTWAIGPEVRRVNDWLAGGFQSITLVSLIPMAATCSLLIPIFERPLDVSRGVRKGLILVLVALAYGVVVGVIVNGASAVFEGLGLFIPFLFVPYALSRPYVVQERDSWLRWLSFVAVLVAAYGWYQFLVAPPWDMQWLVMSGMIGSSGLPEPEAFRAFSTVNSCGALGVYLAATLIVGLCDRRWRRPVGILGSLLIGSCLIITQVRLGWVMSMVGVTSFIAIQRGGNRWMSLVTIIIAAVALILIVPKLPGAELISARFATFNHLEEDSSLQGRIEQAGEALDSIASRPMGSGFGATGFGGKLVSKTGGNGGADNGYVDLALTLGPIMMCVLFAGMYFLGREIWRLRSDVSARAVSARAGMSRHASLALCMLVSYAAGTFMYNNFAGLSGTMLWLVVACSFGQGNRAYLHRSPSVEEIHAPARPMTTISAVS